MKILVTGGAGFIGSHIVDLLIKKGHKVAVVDNLVTGNKTNINPKAKFYKVDICNLSKLNLVFKKERPEFVNHHAAQINVRASLEKPLYDANVNIIGSLYVLECCIKHNVKKLIYASSGGARYGEPKTLPCTETHPIKPLSPYGISKHVIEHYLRLYNKLHNLNYIILAYANVYGPRQDPKGEAGVVSTFINKLLRGETCIINGDGNQTRDFVHVKDVAHANLLALEKETKTHDFNIGTGKETSVNELFKILKQIMEKNVKAQHEPAIDGEINRIFLDINKAKEELDWKPEIPFKKGLQLTFQHFRS